MTVYVDRLCAATTIALFGRGGGHRVSRVLALDALPTGWRLRVYRAALSMRGITVGRLPFFLGDLRTEDGESLYRHLRRQASAAALEQAEAIVARTGFLRELDERYRPGTVALHLAKRLNVEIEPRLRHVAITRTLAGAGARLWVARPERFERTVMMQAAPDLALEWYRDVRAVALLPLLRLRARFHGWALALGGLASGRVPPRDADERPALLVSQQDDLGLDRSLRQQPHWLYPGCRPSFRTYVWMNQTGRRPEAPEALASSGIVPISEREAVAVAAAQRRSPLSRQLLADRRRAVRESRAVTTRPAGYALLTIAQLLRRAYVAAGLCRHFRIGAFFTGENYFVESDAMPLIGEAAGVRTAAYQYSNISHRSMAMLTTADVMMTFSPMYERMWRVGRIGPRRVVAAGYPYRPSFPYVAARARTRRERLVAAGARFVLAYFDESVQADAYGQVQRDRHRAELQRLFGFVLDHQDVGLVVKTQFEANAPSRLCADLPELAQVLASGRYDEMLNGVHRNVFLPAEAALAADLAIGSAIGATASLEAALAGTRTVLLNPFGWRGAWDDLYARCAIVQPDLETALDAIQRFRAGDVEFATLGDWSPILGHFDPYPDADPERCLAQLEALVTGRDAVTVPVAAVGAR